MKLHTSVVVWLPTGWQEWQWRIWNQWNHSDWNIGVMINSQGYMQNQTVASHMFGGHIDSNC